MLGTLKDNVVVDRVMNGVVAGTTSQTSSAVDMEGFDEVTFLAAFGALTAGQVTSIKVQQSDDDGASDAYSDLEGTASPALGDSDGNKILAVTIRNPQKRYLKLVVVRGTQNAVIDGVIALKSRARTVPVTQSADIDSWEVHAFPAEGTA